MVLIVQPEITRELVESIKKDMVAHRIHFATTHSNSLIRQEGNSYIGRFRVPFSNTIEPFLYEITGLILNNSNFGGRWRSVKNEEAYELISEFMLRFKNIVFLRDSLALSVAINFSKTEYDRYTRIGELRNKAKYHNDPDARSMLIQGMPKKIEKLPFYKHTDVICAVPSSNNLLIEIAASVEHDVGMDNISNSVYWIDKKSGLKDIPVHEKWDKLEESGLVVDTDLTGKTVLLLDDLYQSGITMQYVAMKLQQAGAVKIYGLSIVKSLNDTDNV